MKVTFIHPDLGIGGAERLVVDAALALKGRGHSVRFLTSHHDPSHCFSETIDTLDVTVVGDFWPRRLLGRWCYALCAYWRMIWLALYLCFWSKWEFDVVFVDQVSACIPFLRWFKRFSKNPNAKILFYCHFPDMLLTQRKSWLKKLYRGPLDALEEWSTGKADCILVNSRFTESVFRSTFSSLSNIPVTVLYPPVNKAAFDGPSPPFPADLLPPQCSSFFVSLNRYERKKDIGLAIRAFDALRATVEEDDFQRVHLIIAGGYDQNLPENVEHYKELKELADYLEVAENVTFLKSPSDIEKRALLEHCLALLYTPDREHFGIVPVEAMFCRRPVLALRSGGPTETVLDGQTGYLITPNTDETPAMFADRMAKLANNSVLADEMGRRGRERAMANFSFDAFAQKLDHICSKLIEEKKEE